MSKKILEVSNKLHSEEIDKKILDDKVKAWKKYYPHDPVPYSDSEEYGTIHSKISDEERLKLEKREENFYYD